MKQLQEIFHKLGLNSNNGLYLTKDNLWKNETSFPNRVKRLIEREIKPDAFFCFDNKPLILFFLEPADKNKLHKDIWNFNESPIAIIVEKGVVEIYNGFNFDTYLGLLKSLGTREKLNEFSYFEIVTGKTWEQFYDQLNYKNRVDYHLLQNIKTARKLLVEQHNLDAKVANAIIGKSVFTRYLIDRKVKIKFDGKPHIWTNTEFCDLLTHPKDVQRFFKYLEDKDKGFNGDLFPLSEEEFRKIKDIDYEVIRRLLQGEDIEKNQPSLFEFYDFSIIPIEFISNVYELFIGQDNQKNEGAYYTPLFLVDYILNETVEKHLNSEKKVRLFKAISTQTDFLPYCKVLDPACGSGIFLVETLRKIIEKHINDTNINVKSEKFKTTLITLVKQNIFGLDKDESAVQVAIFSIYLTLLDYLEPPDIENFQFPVLLNSNFFVSDFFDESASFNNIFKPIEFDFILGNPPWMRGKGEKKKPLYVNYVENRRKNEKEKYHQQIDIGNKEIAQVFLLRPSDFSKEKTRIAFIVTSKVLYNLQSIRFRRYFLDNYFIERVFELSSVRREVFDKSNDKAITPACILFYKSAKDLNTDSNIIEHISLKPSRFFSLFKIFTINRTDFKSVKQSKLKEFDWLWKVLVYGSYLDFNLLCRLKEDYKTIFDFLNTKETLIKQGIKRKDGIKKIDVSELVGWDFLDLNKKEIQQFYIYPIHEKWSIREVGYVYKEYGRVCKNVFTPPVLLVKETVNTKLESVSAISSTKILFTDKVTSIKFLNANDTKDYYLLAGLMNSTLFAYYILNTSSTAGIMIEQQINDSERFSFPFVYSEEIIRQAQQLELYKKNIHDNYFCEPLNLKSHRSCCENVDQQVIYDSFGIKEHEQVLVEYAKDVAIPITMKHKGFEKLFEPISFKSKYLIDYANLYISQFKLNLSNDRIKFVIEIWHTNQIIGMFFKVVSTSEYTTDIIWNDRESNFGILGFIIGKLGSEKVTDKLFVQKDIRGFEKDYFYIFKPNEKRLWHKAIGFLDVNEFSDAILKVGRTAK